MSSHAWTHPAAWIAVAILIFGVAPRLAAGPARLLEPLPSGRPLSANALAAGADNFDARGPAWMQGRSPGNPGERVLFRQRVRLNAAVLKTGEPIELEVEGKKYTLHRVDEYTRPGGETYFYSTDPIGPDGEGGVLSTFTTFDDGRPFWSSLSLDGKSYELSPEGDHYVLKRALYPRIREAERMFAPREPREPVARVQAMSFEPGFTPMASDAQWSVTATRRRACCTWWNRIPFVVVVNVGAKNPYGITDKAKVEARVAYYFDLMNAALRNSGETNFVYYREIAYLSFPDSVPDNGYYNWAKDDPGVEEVRARNKAAASVLLLGRFVQHQASMLSPAPYMVKPSYRIAIAGGYLRDDSKVDALTTAHEMGHVLGKDHEYKWSQAALTGVPDLFPKRIGWSSCERMQHCIMAYGDCNGVTGGGMETVEIFSGYRAMKLGYPVDPEVQNSVLISGQVGRELARDWP